MAVQNVQCQLAEMQIGRYVSGEQLSDEALSQLHRHIGRCPSCANVLAERRRALRSMLSHGYAAVTTDVPSSKEHLLIKALRAKANAAEEEAPAAMPSDDAPANPKTNLLAKYGLDGSKGYAKPILFAAALALVLAGMSYFKGGQNSMFGGSADSAFPATDTSQTHPAQTQTVSTSESTPTDPAAQMAASTTEPNPNDAKNAAQAAASDLSGSKHPAKKKVAAQPAKQLSDDSSPAVENRVPQSAIDAARERVRKVDEEEGGAIAPLPFQREPHHARHHSWKAVHHHRRSTKASATIKIYDESGKPLVK